MPFYYGYAKCLHYFFLFFSEKSHQATECSASVVRLSSSEGALFAGSGLEQERQGNLSANACLYLGWL